MDKLNIEYKQIKELKPYKKNAKKHDKTQVEQIANSIKEFGFTQPVIVDENNVVVAGHGRILGAKKAGLKEVPTVCLNDLTEEQIKAYRLVDNKLNESEWDMDLLNKELKELSEEYEDLDMGILGFDIDRDIEEDYEVKKEEEGEIPFAEFVDEESQYVVLKFNSRRNWLNAMTILGLKKVKAYSTRKDGNIKDSFKFTGLGRVVDGMEAFERIAENKEMFEGK